MYVCSVLVLCPCWASFCKRLIYVQRINVKIALKVKVFCIICQDIFWLALTSSGILLQIGVAGLVSGAWNLDTLRNFHFYRKVCTPSRLETAGFKRGECLFLSTSIV